MPHHGMRLAGAVANPPHAIIITRMTEQPTASSRLYDADLLPRRSAGGGRRFAFRVAVWLLVGGALALALRCDVALMRWRYDVLPEGPQGLLKQVFYGFRDFAQIVPIAVAILIVIRLDRARRWTIVATILIAQMLAGIGYNAGKLLVVRYRPSAAIERVGPLDELEQSQTWAGFMPSDRDEALQSFPSGHSASAFAFAGVLAWFYPRLAGLVWSLAVGCAFSRYIDGVHWLSDCVAGAAIGYGGVWLALRPHVWAGPLIRRLEGKPASHR